MSVFPSEAQLSSWIGVCPGNRISAGKNRSSAISRGNRWARTTLVECAWAAISKKDCHLKERFRILCKKGRKTRFDCCRALFSSDPAPHPGKRNRLPRGRSTGGRAQEGTSDSSLCAPAGQLGVAVHSVRPESAMPHHSSAGTRTRHVHHAMSTTRNEPNPWPQEYLLTNEPNKSLKTGKSGGEHRVIFGRSEPNIGGIRRCSGQEPDPDATRFWPNEPEKRSLTSLPLPGTITRCSSCWLTFCSSCCPRPMS